jgi:hypothetical protein
MKTFGIAIVTLWHLDNTHNYTTHHNNKGMVTSQTTNKYAVQTGQNKMMTDSWRMYQNWLEFETCVVYF